MHDWAQASGRLMKRSNVDAALLRTMVAVFLSEYAMVQRAMVWTPLDRVVLGPRCSRDRLRAHVFAQVLLIRSKENFMAETAQ